MRAKILAVVEALACLGVFAAIGVLLAWRG